MQDLGTLGGMNSIAGSINDRGTIVGQADTTATATTGLADAFVDYGAGLVDLNSLIPATAQHHWDLVQALSVNQSGQTAFRASVYDWAAATVAPGGPVMRTVRQKYRASGSPHSGSPRFTSIVVD